ncbi:uridine kinase [Bacillus sp. JCM 19046]|nr:uridine kinase [Bacillus sp. JCM 19045]GAF17134.1 uridine kinase [Bacillus sp. JCM 19046]
MTKAPFVVAVSGVSGGGKTAVSKRLNQRYRSSHILHFDSYTLSGPDDFFTWIDSGGDPNEWDLAPYVNDLNEKLKEPLDVIILDYPFSYEHSQLKHLINLSVFIDTPLDIALGRRVLRDFNKSKAKSILNDLEFYMAKGRKGYLLMLETIRPSADLLVEGLLEIDQIVDEIEREINHIHFKK